MHDWMMANYRLKIVDLIKKVVEIDRRRCVIDTLTVWFENCPPDYDLCEQSDKWLSVFGIT
jgi:hypothetical protein